MKNSADVVIIGGGITGVSIAYNLAKLGIKDVVLLEKNFLASGATGRCGAGVRSQWGTKMNCILARESIKFFENINEILEYDGDCEFKQGGYLLLATTENEVHQFQKNVILQNSLGIPSRMLTPYEAKEIVPFLNTEGIIATAYCHKDGHANPFHVVQAYAQAAQRLGVEINKYTEVVGIRKEGSKITGVVTNKGEIKTNIVVNATEGYSQIIADMIGIKLPVYLERHQALVTEPVEPLLKPMVMSFSLHFYCQQTPHGSFIMGISGLDDIEGYNIDSSWIFLKNMSRKICRILPPLKELRVVRQWAGLYNLTPDRQPILGAFPGVDGFFVATGFSGHGFMIGPMTGLLMAQIIAGVTPIIDISMLDAGRFERNELVLEPSVV